MRSAILAGCLALLSGTAVLAQTTTFSYQGKLELNGAPVNGPTDLRFTLYNAAVDGAVVAGPFLVNDLLVHAGNVSTPVNFGLSPWDGGDRWLEVAVRSGDSAGDYTVLTPRQQVHSAPYATMARQVKGAGILGPIRLDGGQSSSVAYGFSTSGGTGMFSPAIQQIGLATAGTERVRIDNSGDVAINHSGSIPWRFTVADSNHQIGLVDTDDDSRWTLTTVAGGGFGVYKDGVTQTLAVQSDGTVTVEGGKAVVYASGSGELMQFRTVATLSANLSVNQGVDGTLSWGNVGFTSPPSVFVGSFEAGPNGPGDFDKFQVICHEVTTTGCKVRIVNHGSVAASVSQGRWHILIVGPR